MRGNGSVPSFLLQRANRKTEVMKNDVEREEEKRSLCVIFLTTRKWGHFGGGPSLLTSRFVFPSVVGGVDDDEALEILAHVARRLPAPARPRGLNLPRETRQRRTDGGRRAD